MHDTTISFFQHPIPGNEGVEKLTKLIDTTSSKRGNLKPLPIANTIVPPVVLSKEPAEIPTVHGSMISDVTEILSAIKCREHVCSYFQTQEGAPNADLWS